MKIKPTTNQDKVHTMTIRKITTVHYLNRPSSDYADIYKDSEIREFSVRFYQMGIHCVEADYFTDNLDDAVKTAKSQDYRNN